MSKRLVVELEVPDDFNAGTMLQAVAHAAFDAAMAETDNVGVALVELRLFNDFASSARTS